MLAVLGEHRSLAVKSMASPAWRRADTARAEMLFLGCHGTRRVKVVCDRVNGNSALGREGGSQRNVFTIVCRWDWCRNTTSPSGIQGATDVIGGLEKCCTERNVKGSSCLAPRGGQEYGLADPHNQRPLHCSWWIKILAGPAGLSPGPGPAPAPSALAADPPPFQLTLPGLTHTPLPVCHHCPLAQKMKPSGTVGFQQRPFAEGCEVPARHWVGSESALALARDKMRVRAWYYTELCVSRGFNQHRAGSGELAFQHSSCIPHTLTLSALAESSCHGKLQHLGMAGAAGAAKQCVAVGGQRPAHPPRLHTHPWTPAEVSPGWLPTQAQRGTH